MSMHVTSSEFAASDIEASMPHREAHSSGVSWGAVIGGAFVAAALYLILLALGAGFGLSVVSPWSNVGLTAPAAGAIAIAGEHTYLSLSTNVVFTGVRGAK